MPADVDLFLNVDGNLFRARSWVSFGLPFGSRSSDCRSARCAYVEIVLVEASSRIARVIAVSELLSLSDGNGLGSGKQLF